MNIVKKYKIYSQQKDELRYRVQLDGFYLVRIMKLVSLFMNLGSKPNHLYCYTKNDDFSTSLKLEHIKDFMLNQRFVLKSSASYNIVAKLFCVYITINEARTNMIIYNDKEVLISIDKRFEERRAKARKRSKYK